MSKGSLIPIAFFLLCVHLQPLSCSAAVAQQELFNRKIINIYAAGDVGGGYDLYARLLARHYGQFIPSNPSVIVRNMPGAGVLKAANYIYSVAVKDGTGIGAIGGGAATAELFKSQGVAFDPRRFVWLGSMNGEVGLTISWHTSQIKTIRDVFEHEFLVGGTGPTDGNVVFPNVMNKIFDTKFKLVPGYRSTTEIALAIEREELQGTASYHYSSIMASRPQWLVERKVNVLLQLALRPHRQMPDVPMIMDLAQTDEQLALLQLVFARQEMGRPFALPPETPSTVAIPLREAFDAVMASHELRLDAERQKLDLNNVLSGKDTHALIERLYNTSPEIILKAAMATGEAG